MKKLSLCMLLLVLGLCDLVLLPGRDHVWPKSGAELKVHAEALQQQSDVKSDDVQARKGAAEPDSLDEHIRGWVTMLVKEPSFADWKDATWSTYPLGPGTHGWVVILQKEGNEVGYLIVSSDRDGKLSLTEYGTGSKPLFSLQTLYQSMMQREIIANYTLSEFTAEPLLQKERYYEGPLESYWKVTLRHDIFYFDAKNGERLPRLDALAKQPASASLHGGLTALDAEVTDSMAVEPFDPNEKLAWIQGTALPVGSIPELKRQLEQHPELTYSAKLLGGMATYPLAVTGFHKLSTGDAFMAVDHDGIRYLPFAEMASKGQFYP